MIYYSTLLLAMFITMALIPILKSVAVRTHAMDFPSERKVHQAPMPKTGGVAMAIGALVPLVLWVSLDAFSKSVMIGAGIIVVCGLADDIKELGYKAKFLGQLAATLIIILYGGVKIKSLGVLLPEGMLLPDYLAFPLTLFFIVGVTNAINLADGLDGLAGGISLLTFICIGYLAYQGDESAIALFSIAMIGAIFGFLRFNTFPATVFMGDAGSQLIGFLAGTLSVALTQGSTPLSPILPLLLLGFPILDTLTVMLERVREGRSPFVADQRHFHHKLMNLGCYHTEAVFVIYLLQSFLVTAAFVLRFYSDWLLLLCYLVFSGIIITGFWVTDIIGWQPKRYDIIDAGIKGKLKILKEKNIFIKISFNVFKVGLPLLFFLSCFVPRVMPGYFSLFAAVMTVLSLLTWLFRKEWLPAMLRLSLYLFIPFVIYLGEIEMSPWITETVNRLFSIYFGVMVVFMMLTLKLTRRKKGFKTSPMDFLILFVALVIPNLPDQQIQSYQLGTVAAKVITFFFSYEVLIGELRGRLDWVCTATLASLAVLSLRWLII